MIVLLATEGAVVQDADDCTRLHLQTSLAPEAVRDTLASTGTGELIDDSTAWLDVDVLRSRARAAATTPDWEERWAGMIAYAGKKGWISPDSSRVQVHIERG